MPRAVAFDRWVAGLVPTGFDARRLGLPADIAARVDPVAHYTLAATAEVSDAGGGETWERSGSEPHGLLPPLLLLQALLSAGLPDPYELFSFVHVSAVGNATGGGMGGMQSMRRVSKGGAAWLQCGGWAALDRTPPSSADLPRPLPRGRHAL